MKNNNEGNNLCNLNSIVKDIFNVPGVFGA